MYSCRYVRGRLHRDVSYCGLGMCDLRGDIFVARKVKNYGVIGSFLVNSIS